MRDCGRDPEEHCECASDALGNVLEPRAFMARASQKLVNEPRSNVSSHGVQLFVDQANVRGVVRQKLRHERSVRHHQQLAVDFVHSFEQLLATGLVFGSHENQLQISELS